MVVWPELKLNGVANGSPDILWVEAKRLVPGGRADGDGDYFALRTGRRSRRCGLTAQEVYGGLCSMLADCPLVCL